MALNYLLFLQEPEIQSSFFIFVNLIGSFIVFLLNREWPLSLLWSFFYCLFVFIINHALKSGLSYLPTKNLNNQTVVITGAATGIGRAAAIRLAKLGARVIIGIRGQERAKQIAADLSDISNGGQVVGYDLDLSNLNSVQQFAAKIDRVDILINNAGCLKQKYETSTNGIEAQFATNYLGPFYLTQLLLPLLHQSRVINISSLAHHACRREWIDFSFNRLKNNYNELEAYSLTKILQIYHVSELKRRYNIKAYSLHPGTIMTTSLNQHRPFLQYLILQCFTTISKTIEQGSMTTLYCALSDAAKPGAYHSDCQVRQPSELATDSELARTCWDETERLLEQKLN